MRARKNGEGKKLFNEFCEPLIVTARLISQDDYVKILIETFKINLAKFIFNGFSKFKYFSYI